MRHGNETSKKVSQVSHLFHIGFHFGQVQYAFRLSNMSEMEATARLQPYQNLRKCPILFPKPSDREASKERRRKPLETLVGLHPKRSQTARAHRDRTGRGSGKREFPRIGKLLKTERFSGSELQARDVRFPSARTNF